jgi:hypothetical protein
MDFNKMQKIVSSLAKSVDDNERLAVPFLNMKLKSLASDYPNDQTIVMVSDVISKLANRQMFITRAELRSIYAKMHSGRTKFAELMEDELGKKDELKAPTYAPAHVEPLKNLENTDSVLTNALANAFDNKVQLKSYSKEAAEQAKFMVSLNLDSWNIKASKLEVESGNESFIVVKADYDTPKGVTSILVPVEITKGKALSPSVFMGNTGPQDLNHAKIKEYILSQAGKTLKVNAKDIVKTLSKFANPGTELTNAELAVTKLNATKELGAEFGQITGLELNPEPKNLVISLPQSAEVGSFAAKFESPLGIAEFKFGKDKVILGKNVVGRQILGFGFNEPKITVMGSDENSIFYAVSLYGGKTSFRVPVKFSANKALSPDILICNGSISSFNKASINDLLASDEKDTKVSCVTSSMYGLKLSELVDNVRSAMVERNFAKAEDALNILKESDDKAYQSALVIYVNGLSSKKAEESKCSMVVKSGTSTHPVCGHTGLPLHKTYQDVNGNCLPLYRRGMDETYEGNFFLHSKVFG